MPANTFTARVSRRLSQRLSVALWHAYPNREQIERLLHAELGEEIANHEKQPIEIALSILYATISNPLSTSFSFYLGLELLKHDQGFLSHFFNEEPIPMREGAIMALTGGAIAGLAAGLLVEAIPPILYGQRSRTNPSDNMQILNKTIAYIAALAAIPLGCYLLTQQPQLNLIALVFDQIVGAVFFLTAKALCCKTIHFLALYCEPSVDRVLSAVWPPSGHTNAVSSIQPTAPRPDLETRPLPEIPKSQQSLENPLAEP